MNRRSQLNSRTLDTNNLFRRIRKKKKEETGDVLDGAGAPRSTRATAAAGEGVYDQLPGRTSCGDLRKSRPLLAF